MTVRVPDWWEFLLVALGAYRVYRVVARDTITAPARAAVSYPDEEAVTLDSSEQGTGELVVVGSDTARKPLRVYVSTLIRCPWCVGFYVSAAAWALWSEWPRPTEFAMTPWALSAVVGLVAKNLDE